MHDLFRLRLSMPWRWLLLVVLSTHNAHAAEPDFSYMALNGFDKVAVRLDGFSKDFAQYGLDPKAIARRVDDRLRDAGLTTLPLGEATRDPGAGLLIVKLSTREDSYRFLYYSLSLQVKRKIPLNNPAGGTIAHSVWNEGRTGAVRPNELDRVNGLVDELLAQFTAAYRQQNSLATTPAN